MTGLTLQLLGGLRLQDAAGTDIAISSRKARALLAYLAASPAEAHERDRIAAVLWDEVDAELARANLRQALAALRRSLPATEAILRTDTQSVALLTASLAIDLQLLRQSLNATNRTSLQAALNHYRGEFLDGFDGRSVAFAEWLQWQRRAIRNDVSAGFRRLSELCVANEDYEGALSAGHRLLILEPLDEAMHRQLMQLHARRGAITDALRQFRVCRDALRRELDVAPEPATETLYRDLMRRRRSTAEPRDASADADASAPAESVPQTSGDVPNRAPGLRDAIVVVIRFDGLPELEATGDPEEIHLLSSGLQSLVTKSVQEFGGSVDHRIEASFVAVFGLPAACGNEAMRAVRAALLLRERLAAEMPARQQAVRLRVGIAQGQVVCGAELFPLTGRPLQSAHALARHANDQSIVLSDELRRTLGEQVVAERASGQPTTAWTMTSVPASGATRGAFVGRHPELAMILAAIDHCATTRRGRTVVLRGDAGMGKTRLADAVRQAALDRGIAAHTAQVFDFGQSPGRGPVAQLALSLLGLPRDAVAAQRSAAVTTYTQSEGGGCDQIIFLSELIDAPLSAELAALERAMDAASRQRGRVQTFAQLLESTSQQRALLLIVEDVHWSDGEQLSHLGEIAAVVASCSALLLLTTRPDGDPIGTTWRARSRGCPMTTIELAPLAREESLELAAQYPQLAPQIVSACIARAEGYPLFLDQLLRAADTGLSTLPGSVRALVVSRADRLNALDTRALHAAAILGHRMHIDALQALLDEAEYAPVNLVDAGLLQFDGGDLQFAHALFRDAIYESILRSQRQELHLRAAQWFANRDKALHAEHLAAANDPGAAHAYRLAAQADQTALRFEQALALAGKAYALAHEPQLLHEISCLVGELQLQLGRTHDGLASYREALDFAPDQVCKGMAWFGIASALRVMDRHDEALDALDAAEAALAHHSDHRLRARMCTLRGNLCFPLGRMDACLSAHQQALEHAQAADSPAELARAYSGIGDAWYQRGRMLSARDLFAQCVEAARRHRLTGILATNLPMLAISHHYSGNLPLAQQLLEEGLVLTQQIGDLRGELIVQLCSGSVLLTQGRVQESRAHAQRAIDLAHQLGARRFHAEALGILALTYVVTDNNAEATSLAQDALQISRDTGMTYCGPSLLSIAARATADSELCTALLAEGEALLARGCVSHSYFEFYNNAIEVSLQRRLPVEARRYAQELERYTLDEPSPWTQLLSKRAMLLADAQQLAASATTSTALHQLRTDCLRLQATSLVPMIDDALCAIDTDRGDQAMPV